MVWHDGHASVQAGAGIVADSIAADEDLECRNKAKALLTALAAARELEPLIVTEPVDLRPQPVGSRGRERARRHLASCRASCRRTSIRSTTARRWRRCCCTRRASSTSRSAPRRARRRRLVARHRARLRPAPRRGARPLQDPGEGRDRRSNGGRRAWPRWSAIRSVDRARRGDTIARTPCIATDWGGDARESTSSGPADDGSGLDRRVAGCGAARRRGARGAAHRGRRPELGRRRRRVDDPAGGVPRASTRCRSRRAASSARSSCAASTRAAT